MPKWRYASQKYAWQPEWPDGISCIYFELEEILSQHGVKRTEVLTNLFQLIVVTVSQIHEQCIQFGLKLPSQCNEPRQFVLPHDMMLLPEMLFFLLTRCSLDTFQLQQCCLSRQLVLRDLRLQLFIVHWSVTSAPDAFSSTAHHSLCIVNANTCNNSRYWLISMQTEIQY